MPADTLWSFCMALNIYLAFYKKFSAEDLKKLEKWYFSFCYGLPLALAIVLQVIKTKERGRIYGPALVRNFWPRSRTSEFVDLLNSFGVPSPNRGSSFAWFASMVLSGTLLEFCVASPRCSPCLILCL